MHAHLKRTLRRRFPRSTAYISYPRALFQNEIELRLLPWLCDRTRTTIDVGAYHGMYALGACIHSKDVIAVEPQHTEAEFLRRSMPRNVRVVEAALSNVSGAGLLKQPSVEGAGDSRLDPLTSLTEGWLEVSVKLLRLDDLARERVGFVKIDVEGHELEVLEGALETIESDRPTFLIEAEERHRPGTVARVVDFLRRLGYSGFFIDCGKIHPVQEFDAAKHQDPKQASLIVGDRRGAYANYINNFIFLHHERAPSIPGTVPSAPRAVWNTMRNFIS
jgi:FkbM family methyltransferase